MRQRALQLNLKQALTDTRVLFINGPRQCGKSTLVKSLAGANRQYISLDDLGYLASAWEHPATFIDALGPSTILDEVQRSPALLLAIKARVDRDQTPGQFILTGSANILLLPQIADSLAGRMEVLTLRPFAQAELDATARDPFLPRLFAADWAPPETKPVPTSEVWERVASGGYPEALTRDTAERRQAWFDSYLTTIVQRDIREWANIEGLTQIPRLLAILAARTAGQLNLADVSRSSGTAESTLRRYLTLLQTAFLLDLVPAWTTNRGKRLVKAPKVFINDTGLACFLLGTTTPQQSLLSGQLLENFVAAELLKQISWSAGREKLFHFRTAAGREVDFVIERPGGDIAGVEVKSAPEVSPGDFNGLRELASLAEGRFRRGIILYLGNQVRTFGPDLHAVPLSSLWRWPALPL